jgi:hypothetical protein
LETWARLATFFGISSSVTALVSALHRIVQASRMVRSEASRRQHVAGTLAQQRRCFSVLRASLPWAQHWHVSLSLFSQLRTSRNVSLSSRLEPRPGKMYSRVSVSYVAQVSGA